MSQHRPISTSKYTPSSQDTGCTRPRCIKERLSSKGFQTALRRRRQEPPPRRRIPPKRAPLAPTRANYRPGQPWEYPPRGEFGPLAHRVRRERPPFATRKATVRHEEGLRSGVPALEGHVLAGPYPQLVGLVALHLRERADIGARVLTGSNLPAMAGYTPSARPNHPPPARHALVKVLAGPHQLADHGGSRRHTRATGTGAPSWQGGYGSRRCAPPHPRAVVSRGRAPPSGATQRWFHWMGYRVWWRD